MLLFGHLGIPLGAALLVNGALKRCGPPQKAMDTSDTGASAPRREQPFHQKHLLDLRFLLLGSILPDLIDKPLWQFLTEVFQNGRIFAHTLLFFVVLLLAGTYLYRKRGRSWLLMLSLGVMSHIILDRMWGTPQTLFWPAFGWAFPRVAGDWSSIIRGLLTNPAVYVPELIGLSAIGWLAFTLLRSRRVRKFLRDGIV